MRKLAITVTVTAVAAAAVLAAAPAATADDAVGVASGGSYTLTGHGFGHGHGMSQYGAEGAARQGRTYAQILAFYYPGTTLSTTSGSIRVLISADRGSDTVVKAVSGLAVRDMADGKRFTLPVSSTISKWRIVPIDGSSVGKVQYYRSGTWTRWTLPGRTNLKGDGQFEGARLGLVLPSGSTKTYRTILRNVSPSKGSKSRVTVNVPTIENYVAGVVAAEMPSSWHASALRAQTVAARTYALNTKTANINDYYQICDTTACQVYGGVASERASTNAAVAATKGRYLSYKGKPAFTQFSSSSGGYTAKGSVPYLTTKKDVYDGWSGNPVHTWKKTLTAAQIQRAYPKIGTVRSARVLSRNGAGDWGGRVTSVRLTGSKSSVTISGETMRSVFGLRSNWFTFGSTMPPLSGPIANEYARHRASLGSRQTGIRNTNTAGLRYAKFSNGKAYARGSKGYSIWGSIDRMHAALGGTVGTLGTPTKGVTKLRSGLFYALFSKGRVYSVNARSYAGYGPVNTKYVALRGTKSRLGTPTTSIGQTSRTQYQKYRHGYIRWVKKTGRYEIKYS